MSNTSAPAELKDIFKSQFETFEKSLNGMGSLPTHQTRKNAIASFETLGLPGSKSEEYKYTPITRLLQKNFQFNQLTEGSPLSKEVVSATPFYDADAHILVFENGVFNTSLSKVSDDDALEIISLHEGFEQNVPLVEKHFGKYLSVEKDAFAALNTAFASHGVCIRIKKGKTVSKPVLLTFVTSGEKDEITYYPRNLIIAEENSEINIVENFVSSNKGQAFINQCSEIVVERNARLNYFKVQNEAEGTYHVDNSQVIQYQDSLFNAYTFSFDGSLIRNNLSISLEEEHCESHMYGLYLTHGTTHVDNHTVVDHKEANSFSNEIYKGIINDKSRGVFNGKIYVRQPAQKTNAFQSNKNILLTDEATVNTKPQLEIWADDVKCSHGCTTGQLDEESLFYLRSRGIGKQQAKIILLHAFANDVLEQVKIDFLKEYIETLIHKELD